MTSKLSKGKYDCINCDSADYRYEVYCYKHRVCYVCLDKMDEGAHHIEYERQRCIDCVIRHVDMGVGHYQNAMHLYEHQCSSADAVVIAAVSAMKDTTEKFDLQTAMDMPDADGE